MFRTLFVPFWCWLKGFVADRRASELMEQLLIIAIAFLLILVILGFITGAFDWVFLLAEDIFHFLDDWTPFPKSPDPFNP